MIRQPPPLPIRVRLAAFVPPSCRMPPPPTSSRAAPGGALRAAPTGRNSGAASVPLPRVSSTPDAPRSRSRASPNPPRSRIPAGCTPFARRIPKTALVSPPLARSQTVRPRRRAPTSRCQKQKILREAPPSETVLPESPHLRRAALLRRNSPAPVRKKPAHSTHASVAYK